MMTQFNGIKTVVTSAGSTQWTIKKQLTGFIRRIPAVHMVFRGTLSFLMQSTSGIVYLERAA